MNADNFMSPSSGIQYLSVCQYINSFGVFLSSIGLLPFNERDLPVVVINALFRHLNNSNNETQTKIQLLKKALKENNFYTERHNMTLEISDVNKTFQYIITAALFSHTITGYVSGFENTGNTSSEVLKQHVRNNLSRSFISNSLCSSKNRYSKLTALSIDKLLHDFVLPAFITDTIKTFGYVQQENIPVLKRSKRQPNRSSWDSAPKTQEDPFAKMHNIDVSLNAAETYEAHNFLPSEHYYENLSASELLHVLDEINDNIDVDDIYMEFANDVQLFPQILENNEDYASETPGTSEKYKILPLQSFETPNSNIMSTPETTAVDNLDDRNVESYDAKDLNLSNIEDPLVINDVSDNDYLPPAKIPKVDKRKYDSKVEILDEDDVPGTSKRMRVSPLQGHAKFVTEELEEYDFDHMLKDIRAKGFGSLKENKEDYLKFQLKLYKMLIFRQKYPTQVESLDLWYSETTNRIEIIQLLNSLKGKEFFFNDITLLTRTDSNKLPWQKSTPDSFDVFPTTYKIHYHLKIDSTYKLVKLNDSENIEEHYFTFPEVMFTVKYTEILKKANNTILIMELISSFPSQKEWSTIVQQKFSFLFAVEEMKSKRLLAIEKAANLISSVVPKHTLIKSINILKDYILKVEESDSPVPTYDQLAKEYCDILDMPKGYEKWEIHLKEIDDVLFKTNSDYKIDYATSKLIGIDTQFGKNYWNEIQETYRNSSVLQKSLRLDDYFLLLRFLKKEKMILKTKLLVIAALYRLALRQCEDYNNEIPITLYRAEHQITWKDFSTYMRKHSRILYQPNAFAFHSYSTRRDVEEQKLNSTSRLIELKLDNLAGIVNLDIITGTTDGMYSVPDELTVDIVANGSIIIDGLHISFVKIHDKSIKEDKMVAMAHKLEKLLTDIKISKELKKKSSNPI